jgi:hypothetical protein
MARSHDAEHFSVSSVCIGIRRRYGYDYRPEPSLRIQIFRFTLSLLATSPIPFYHEGRPMEGNPRIPRV